MLESEAEDAGRPSIVPSVSTQLQTLVLIRNLGALALQAPIFYLFCNAKYISNCKNYNLILIYTFKCPNGKNIYIHGFVPLTPPHCRLSSYATWLDHCITGTLLSRESPQDLGTYTWIIWFVFLWCFSVLYIMYEGCFSSKNLF